MLALLLIVVLGVAAQDPAATPPPDPIEQAMADLHAAIAETKKELQALRAERAQRERAARAAEEARQQKRPAQRTTRQRKVPKRDQADEPLDPGELTTAVELRLQKTVPLHPITILVPPNQRRVIVALAIERDLLREKIERANRRWHCRFLRIGCIGRK